MNKNLSILLCLSILFVGGCSLSTKNSSSETGTVATQTGDSISGQVQVLSGENGVLDTGDESNATSTGNQEPQIEKKVENLIKENEGNNTGSALNESDIELAQKIVDELSNYGSTNKK